MALQAKSFSTIITAEPLTLHRGPTEEDKQRKGVTQGREREAKKRDGFPEREASTVLGGIVVTVLYSSSVYSRETDEHVRREEGWCLMHVIVSRNMTAPHYFLFQSPSAYWSTCAPANLFILFPHASLHLGIDYLDNRAKEEKLQKVGARDEIKTHLSVFAKEELESAATQQLSWWQNGRQAGRTKMKFDSISRTLTCSGNANPWY